MIIIVIANNLMYSSIPSPAANIVPYPIFFSWLQFLRPNFEHEAKRESSNSWFVASLNVHVFWFLFHRSSLVIDLFMLGSHASHKEFVWKKNEYRENHSLCVYILWLNKSEGLKSKASLLLIEIQKRNIQIRPMQIKYIWTNELCKQMIWNNNSANGWRHWQRMRINASIKIIWRLKLMPITMDREKTIIHNYSWI